jgi:DNA-binding HxlR family transcriptional regulator
VEYELSEYGWSVTGILESLSAWGLHHIEKVYGDKSAVLEDNILNI